MSQVEFPLHFFCRGSVTLQQRRDYALLHSWHLGVCNRCVWLEVIQGRFQFLWLASPSARNPSLPGQPQDFLFIFPFCQLLPKLASRVRNIAHNFAHNFVALLPNTQTFFMSLPQGVQMCSYHICVECSNPVTCVHLGMYSQHDPRIWCYMRWHKRGQSTYHSFGVLVLTSVAWLIRCCCRPLGVRGQQSGVLLG
jgi:hypothetical protein